MKKSEEIATAAEKSRGIWEIIGAKSLGIATVPPDRLTPKPENAVTGEIVLVYVRGGFDRTETQWIVTDDGDSYELDDMAGTELDISVEG